MQILLIIIIAVHVLSSIFWAGSTFVLARSGGVGASAVFAPQISAAGISLLSGLSLWHLLHPGSLQRAEQILAAGAIAAVLALLVQIAMVRPGLRPGEASPRIAAGYRVSGVLLALTAICMAAARHI